VKAEINEYEGAFSLNIEAETMDDVIKLARFGIGKLKRLDYCDVHFFESGKAQANIVIGKNKNKNTTL
jgi:hypothetical protein